jgi:hypothetical protein
MGCGANKSFRLRNLAIPSVRHAFRAGCGGGANLGLPLPLKQIAFRWNHLNA